MKRQLLQLILVGWIAGAVLFLTCKVTFSFCEGPPKTTLATADQIQQFFENEKKYVVTFVGYSGAEYENKQRMLSHAEDILDGFEPSQTLVNIGGTPEGIGAVYNMAKQKGFRTTGIVSTLARKYGATLSDCVDVVFYVEDSSWGGFLDEGKILSPTSTAMVENSDLVTGIGGGQVARDELIAAEQSGKKVRFFAAEMNHIKAQKKAAQKGLAAPTDLSGAAGAYFSGK